MAIETSIESSYSSSTRKQSIVVVGGGPGGLCAARAISEKLDLRTQTLTLISARPSMIYLTASARLTTTAEQKLEENAIFPIDGFLKEGRGMVRVGRVQSVEDGKEGGAVVLENGERIAYDVLIVAPGARWRGPLDFPDDKEETLAHINDWRRKFGEARSVVLVGGGTTGVEFAGEIKDFYPDTKVTIVHSNSHLLSNTFPDKFRDAMRDDLEACGIEVILDDRIEDLGVTGTVTTRKGRQIEADLVVPCVGNSPATDFLTALGEGVLDAHGYILTSPQMQLPAHPRIFAAGDAVAWQQEKLGGAARVQGEVAAANALALLAGAPLPRIYKGKRVLSVAVTNGRYHGLSFVGLFGGIVLGNRITSLAKGRTLQVQDRKSKFVNN
ncbi:FAD/NAD-P-binding domain-containing protein [Gloeopeniophorella convolvens]|nr:FAD/NAD-P-binding domain-containing protein [Gloeopeniophorella convolvens]